VKTLVVWYSNSGTTALLAERIARELGADLEAIEETKPRPKLLIDGQTSPEGGRAMPAASFAAMLGLGSPICDCRMDPSQYDLVVVGTPVWVRALTPPVRSYLKRHGKSLSRVAFFCTGGEPDKARVFGQMRRLARKDPVATLAVKSDDARSDACGDAVAQFVAQLKATA